MAVLCITALGCLSKNDDNVKPATVAEFAEIITHDDVVLVDVRSGGEYADGHIARALNVAWGDTFKDTFAARNIAKDNTIAVYCHSGKRSSAAAKSLTGMGYRVVNLTGGITAWQREGRRIEK